MDPKEDAVQAAPVTTSREQEMGVTTYDNANTIYYLAAVFVLGLSGTEQVGCVLLNGNRHYSCDAYL
jgi:hypothetical protein